MTKKGILAAVQRLDLESTEALLRAKPSLATVTDRQGRNLLHLACSVPTTTPKASQAAQIRLVAFLLTQRCELDRPVGADACTPLFFAVARARNPRLAELLIKRGAKVTSAPGGGLLAAGWWEDLKSLDLLLRAGAAIGIVVSVTPFLACWCSRRFEAARLLGRRGTDVNFQDRKGRTALHHGVAKEFDPALLKWLAKHGVSPDIADADGVTLRARASRKRDKRFRAALR